MNGVYKEDFFIYVPSSNTAEVPIHDTWERVVLKENIVVYTHALSEGTPVGTDVSRPVRESIAEKDVIHRSLRIIAPRYFQENSPRFL